ncbi:type II secretion system protein [Candidatus Dependentiae bacterium]|nr:type II secretion system protein [Candidatus Dependentiae bacterium]
MHGNKSGFSLIELLIVLFILGLVGLVAIPNLRFRNAEYERKDFVAKFESLIRSAWLQTLQTQQTHRVNIDLKARTILVERVVRAPEKSTKENYEPVIIPYVSSPFKIPVTIELRQFFIQGSDMLNQPGIKIETIWFYIVPEGLVQEVIINAIDLKDLDAQGKAKQFSLIINPFTAQLSEYDAFSKP